MNSEDKIKIMNNQEKGITLVMLVITIVVMCILTGVTVNQTISEDGIFHSITQIGQKSKSEQEEAAESTKEEIKNKLDTAEGAKYKEITDCELNVVELRYKYIAVELKLVNYELVQNDTSYSIDDIGYKIKKVDGSSNYENYKHGDDKYNCSFSGLDVGTYEITAVAENESGMKKDLKSVTATITDLQYQIGDWVDYDAGIWTQAEINSLGTVYSTEWNKVEGNFTNKTAQIKGEYLTNKFSGMSVGYNKNISQSYTVTGASGSILNLDGAVSSKGHESVVTSVQKGWRILDITDDGKLVLVSAGIPEYYIARAMYVSLTNVDHSTNSYDVWINSYYVEKSTLQGINQRNFSEYMNSDYAESARMMTKKDVDLAITKGPSNLTNIGATYIQSTVIANDKNNYSVSDALTKGIYGENSKDSWLTFYKKSFSDGPYYSAGLLGVRVVVTLKGNIQPNITSEQDGKSYAKRWKLIDKLNQ